MPYAKIEPSGCERHRGVQTKIAHVDLDNPANDIGTIDTPPDGKFIPKQEVIMKDKFRMWIGNIRYHFGRWNDKLATRHPVGYPIARAAIITYAIIAIVLVIFFRSQGCGL